MPFNHLLFVQKRTESVHLLTRADSFRDNCIQAASSSPRLCRQAEWALFKSPQQTDSSEELVGGSQRALLKISKGKTGAPTHHPDRLARHTHTLCEIRSVPSILIYWNFSDFYVHFLERLLHFYIFHMGFRLQVVHALIYAFPFNVTLAEFAKQPNHMTHRSCLETARLSILQWVPSSFTSSHLNCLVEGSVFDVTHMSNTPPSQINNPPSPKKIEF